MFMPAMPGPSRANTQACLGGAFLGMLKKHTRVYNSIKNINYVMQNVPANTLVLYIKERKE